MIEVLVLGPIELRRDGEIVPVPGGKPRAVLAALVIDPTRAVSQDRLIEALWGESAPARAASNLHVHVATLRKLLGDDGATIETTGGGYRLRIDPDHVDAFRFERLVREAHDRTDAAERLRKALALWRGPALAEVADEPFAQTAARRLEESRLGALEQRIDADLALGHHCKLVPELEALVADHPLRERLAGQLMRALYASGRQADALAVYRELRRRLVDELGIEPGPELQALERSVLQQDPALRGQPRAGRAPPHRRRRLAVAIGVMLVLAAAIPAAVLVLSGSSSKPRPPPVVVANSLVQLDPATGRVVSVTPVGDTPVSLATTPAAIWVVNRGDRTVSRVDRRTHTVRTIGGVPFANDIAADGHGNIWVSSSAAPVVTRITDGTANFPAGASPPETIRTPPLAGALAVGAGYLWVTNSNLRTTGNSWFEVGRDTVSLVDLRSHRLVRSIPAGPIPYAIAVGYGSAWIADFADIPSVSVIRAGSSRAETIPLSPKHDGTPLGITTGQGSVWALTYLGKLIRIDPDTRRIRSRISFGNVWSEPLMVTNGAGYLWVTARLDYSVVKIDPRSNRVVRKIPLGHIGIVPCGILATETAVWVTMGADDVCGSPGSSY